MLYREKHANEGKARGLEKSPQGQVFVEAHHEEVQGRELRGQGNFQWNTGSHRDEEARELQPPGYHRTCTVERRNTNLEELTKKSTADLFTKNIGMN